MMKKVGNIKVSLKRTEKTSVDDLRVNNGDPSSSSYDLLANHCCSYKSKHEVGKNGLLKTLRRKFRLRPNGNNCCCQECRGVPEGEQIPQGVSDYLSLPEAGRTHPRDLVQFGSIQNWTGREDSNHNQNFILDQALKDTGRMHSSDGYSLTRELFKLSKYGWYWGPVTRAEAEEKLTGQPDGTFLVRDSSDDRYLLSLSFRSYGKTLHTRIEHCNGMFSFYAQAEPEGHASIVDLIEHSMNFSQSGVFCYSRARSPGSPSFPVRLAKPVSRFTQVRSLQYLCRFVIRQYTRFDHIQRLPLPTRIKGYIEEGQF